MRVFLLDMNIIPLVAVVYSLIYIRVPFSYSCLFLDGSVLNVIRNLVGCACHIIKGEKLLLTYHLDYFPWWFFSHKKIIFLLSLVIVMKHCWHLWLYWRAELNYGMLLVGCCTEIVFGIETIKRIWVHDFFWVVNEFFGSFNYFYFFYVHEIGYYVIGVFSLIQFYFVEGYDMWHWLNYSIRSADLDKLFLSKFLDYAKIHSKKLLSLSVKMLSSSCGPLEMLSTTVWTATGSIKTKKYFLVLSIWCSPLANYILIVFCFYYICLEQP